MKHYVLLALMSPLLIPIANTCHAGTLDVTIDNNQPTGPMMVEVYDNQSNYQDGKDPIARFKMPAKDKPLQFEMSDLASGDYAVRMFQDLNSNGQLDANWLGIPNEPYGFSNNGGAYGPASFDDAKVAVIEGETTAINITLR
ncbi:DUF2141 domain-containing protein [Neiella sp. HB171785]|uniref:DUF2141 domain-containing protein n=1 Tax=Neiella litorisoli TaxID=2771431 RepID=A0A8J6QMJ3_9GAMM|nr:DUF2141 domain-containing protein [Neiella litorisoli]MBD1391212.1 DUF2141 domain-containing protein [Neiella litorisoli]